MELLSSSTQLSKVSSLCIYLLQVSHFIKTVTITMVGTSNLSKRMPSNTFHWEIMRIKVWGSISNSLLRWIFRCQLHISNTEWCSLRIMKSPIKYKIKEWISQLIRFKWTAIVMIRKCWDKLRHLLNSTTTIAKKDKCGGWWTNNQITLTLNRDHISSLDHYLLQILCRHNLKHHKMKNYKN